MNDEIRVLLVDDSPTVRLYLKTIIEETAGMRVVGIAPDGVQAVELAHELRPDVVSMDVRMPQVDGLEATRRIMAQCPTPVVVVSGLLDVDVQLSLNALEAGALAVVSKPPDRQHPEFPTKRQQLITTLKAMAGVRVIARRERLFERSVTLTDYTMPQPRRPQRRTTPEVVVIGASTGGPSALHRLVQALPPAFPLPILIVQHMPPEFLAGLARWLDSATELSVSLAQEGQRLRRGEILVAPGHMHTVLVRRGVELIVRGRHEMGNYRYQPAVDVLFASVAQACGSAAIGMILTGMGDDGAAGLLAMRQAGAYTFAQDEASSIVFGMPAAAIGRGAAERIEPLMNLVPEMLKLI
jgi:two-component system chemotaxis response regulator CheB